jgi:hypothetical protein
MLYQMNVTINNVMLQQRPYALTLWDSPLNIRNIILCFSRKVGDNCLPLEEARSSWCYSPFSVTMTSVCPLPNWWICCTAASKPLTASIVHSRAPYSTRKERAGGGPNVRSRVKLGPEFTFTWNHNFLFNNIKRW